MVQIHRILKDEEIEVIFLKPSKTNDARYCFPIPLQLDIIEKEDVKKELQWACRLKTGEISFGFFSNVMFLFIFIEVRSLISNQNFNF